MATIATINGLPLDEGSFMWPLYRGASPQRVVIHGFGARWEEYRDMVAGLGGEPAKIVISGSRRPGGEPSKLPIEIAEVFVTRAIRVSEVKCELWCYDSRLKLREHVNAMDFNMKFGDGFLEGTERATYRDAIESFCNRYTATATRMADDAYDRIPDRDLESNVHLSAMQADDPLAYLCHRANVDPVVGLDGKWYFAERADATLEWFTKYEREAWRTRPGFLALEHLVLQRPQVIRPYYWEHHCIKVEGSNQTATVATRGPDELRVELEQVYQYNGEYMTLQEMLLEAFDSATATTDARIAQGIFGSNGRLAGLAPLDSVPKITAWATIRRDWRRLWRVTFPDSKGHIGGWDQFRFGKLNADGSIDPTSVECKWVEFHKHMTDVGVKANGNFKIDAPWTFNNDAPSPFIPMWDAGPESGVVRLYVDPDRDSQNDIVAPMPGELYVRSVVNQSGVADTALRYRVKPELGTRTAKATARNIGNAGRDHIEVASMKTSFTLAIYMVARRFMPNDETRWHAEDVDGFDDGDIELQELPPSDEVFCYRTFVGTAEDDGLGSILNQDELTADAERRAEVYKITSAAIGGSEGRADTLNIAAANPRVVDGPVQSVGIHLEGVETYTTMRVGDLGDDKARQLIANRRVVMRNAIGRDAQGRNK